jgi:anti-sigma B factor antagonist
VHHLVDLLRKRARADARRSARSAFWTFVRSSGLYAIGVRAAVEVVLDARTQARSGCTRFRAPESAKQGGRMLSKADNPDSSLATAVPFAIQRRALNPRASVISVEGDLDLASAPRLKWMLVDALGEGHSQLILDLSLATFMDSTALGVLVGVNRSLEHGAALAIVCAHANLLKIFELSGMDGAFAISPTIEQALARLDGPSAQAPPATQAS